MQLLLFDENPTNFILFQLQRYQGRTAKNQTIIIIIEVAMATIMEKFHSMVTIPKNILIDSSQMEIFRQINPI